MPNAIERDVYVLRNTLKNPIAYVRGTDLLPIIFHFRDFTIPSGATATAFTAKPDGNAVYGSAVISGNDVTIDVTQQMFIVLGMSMLQVEIKEGEETLTTFIQPVMVTPNLKAGDLPESTTDIEFLDEAIEQAQEAVKDAQQAIADANTAISGANTAAESANSAAQNANNAAEELQDKVDAGDFTASVQVGTTTTLNPGQDATVSNSGTNKDAVLNFGIPKGDPGTAATIQVGTTQTVQPEANAEVTNTGTANAAVLDFKIPRGEDGMTDLTAEYKDASEYTCQPTVNAPVVVKELDGKTEQAETTGKNLFNINGNVNTQGNDYQQLNVNTVSGNVLTCNVNGQKTNAVGQTISGLNSKTVTFSAKVISFGSGIEASIFVYENGGYNNNLVYAEEVNSVIKITCAISTDNPVFAFATINGTGAQFTDIQVEIGETNTDWEPYTGGQPAPSPDYPQVIKGVGGMGYFDGVWVQGNISSTGTVGTETTGITSANAIPCKQNDNIAVTYEDSIDVIAVAFYNASGAYISTSTSGNNVDTFTATAPANAASFKVNLRVVSGSTITPNGAKYCTVAINGKYQTEIKSRNINLWNGPEQYTGSVYISSTFDWTGKDTIYIEFDALTDNANGQVVAHFDYYDKNNIRAGRNSIAKKVSTSFTHFSTQFDGTNSVNVAGKTDLTKIKYMTAIFEIYRSSASKFSVKNIMISDEQLTDVEYVTHKEYTISIPLTSPLYSGDKICYVKPGESYVDADGDTVVADRILYGCYRENALIESYNSESVPGEYVSNTGQLSTGATVVYKLATPFFEPFEDQSIFYDLRTDDELTYIYSDDPLNPILTVEVAKNSTGGYLLESYAQAQKNAIAEANSQSRISAIEQQLVNQATAPTE